MLKRSTLRGIKQTLGRYIAIAAIVGLGVGFFSGLRMCMPDMVNTADKYLDDHNFYDYEILSSYGVDQGSVEIALKTDGVAAAETSMQKDIVITVGKGDESYDSVFKAISVPEKINTLNLVEGRLPEKKNECVIDNYSTVGTSFEVGDTLTLSKANNQNDLDAFKSNKYKIVGKVNSPLYLDYERGSTNLGSGILETFFYINRNSFATDYDTQMYVKLEGDEDAFSKALSKKLDKYQQAMTELSKKVTAGRKDIAQQQAQEMLDGKKAEYNAGVAKYNREKAIAEGKIASGKNQIISGINTANQNESQLRNTLAQLQSAQIQINNGYKQIENREASLLKQYGSGEITHPEYELGLLIIRQSKEELDSNAAQVKDGIAQVNAALEKIKNSRKQISSGQKTLVKEEKQGRNELATAKAELDRAKAALDAAQDQIDEMNTGNHYAFSREENTGYSSYKNNSEIVNNVAKVFPAFFLLVAILVVMTTMSRMVDDQRSQIGVLRALGYSNSRIRLSYLFYSGSATLLGSVIGYFIGCVVFPTTVWQAYTIMYDFAHKIDIHYDWKLGVLATLVAMFFSMFATWISCSNEFKEVAAELIKPRTPPAGKRIFLERFTWLWDKMSFMYKVSFRNVFRYKKRFIMMVLGIAGCTALMIAGLGMHTSISGTAEAQYGKISPYDYLVAFNQEMPAASQKTFAKEAKKAAGDYGDVCFIHMGDVDVKIDNGIKGLGLYVADKDELEGFFNFGYDNKEVKYPGKGEVIMCRKMQDQYGIKIGDTVELKEGYREMTAKVAGFYDNYIEETMFMSKDTYKAGMKKDASVSTALVNAPEKLSKDEVQEQATALSNIDSVALTKTTDSIVSSVDTMMKSMNSMVYVIIFCAALLAFIVVYNLTNINILERIREIATIKVLGFYNKETASYVFRENIILTIISVILGMPLGKLLLNYVISNINFDMIFFLPKLTPLDYAMAVVATIAFTLLINLVLRPKLAKVSMAESLKTTE